MAKGVFPETPATIPTKACRICGEPIQHNARKCIHCTSWQDWRGEIGAVETTTLSLLISLMSVSIAAVPILTSALTPAKPILRSKLQSVGDSEVAVLVSNTGGGDVVFTGASVSARTDVASIRDGNNRSMGNFFDLRTKEAQAVLIPPRSSKLIQLQVSYADVPDLDWFPRTVCDVNYAYVGGSRFFEIGDGEAFTCARFQALVEHFKKEHPLGSK